MVRKGPLLSV